jgi:hypothetical protein
MMPKCHGAAAFSFAFLYKCAITGSMTTRNDSKIKQMLAFHTPGAVLLASWLEDQGISRDLQKHYRRSGWLESVGTGAFKRAGDEVTWQGGLYALQKEAGLPIHAGAMTALSLLGYAHYVRLGGQEAYLFSPRGTNLPAWFRRHDWNLHIQHVPTTLLPSELGLVDHEEKTFEVRISSPERAMLECLYLAPKAFDLVECYQAMEGLANLRPKLVQELLIACNSVKSKRLFLYMAEKSGHQWLSFVDTTNVDLGKGERSLSKGGVHIPKYNLVVPQALAAT